MMRPKQMDVAVVVDIEGTCWESEAERKANVSEVVEVGHAVVDLDAPAVLYAPESYVVRLTRSVVSPFCERLTGMTAERVAAEGVPFEVACAGLWALAGRGQGLWCSWGDYDRIAVARQCDRERLRYPFGTRHVNLKTLCAMVYGWPIEVGMGEALRRLRMDPEGEAHRGKWDAWNIARILVRTLKDMRRGAFLKEGTA
jgi:inhibitor of KinA sporulation pathway (predicted exonuclease)